MTDSLPEEDITAIREALFAGRKIEAIKRYRECTGQGLREAKDFIDSLNEELRQREPERFTAPAGGSGCATAAALTLVLAALSFWCG